MWETAGKIGRYLAVWLREDKYNLILGHLDEAKLAQHAAEEDHKTERTDMLRIKSILYTGYINSSQALFW